MNTLTLGVPTEGGPFRIVFTYAAQGKAYTDEFTSPIYLAQGDHFPVSYNPLSPQQNNKSRAAPTTRTLLYAIGIAGSIILSLLWLAILRGC